ncbi:HD domain-containing phosphohydrolase [uncultured Sphaerochaeta sp.]|uniref:HD-GYP domain-containing protein n=1 Tax=uncultured Sphaerochaeta sp. TaxID=886478 RepID=UPI002A0A879F|nr:HD domain-containing phosphohydrolase [uncultured Sphaerochaeta sp.]
MIQDVMMMALGSLAETRDNETGNHIRRTQNYIRVLAQNLTNHPRFSGLLTDETIELFYKSAPLHDIGKVGIPDRILNKPSKLTDEEFTLMKTHTTIGHNAILKAEQALGSQNTFLSVACDLAWSHHEKWDGSGYPRGLSGDEIPLAGRLMAIPDVYDALISERVYKKAFSHEEAVTIITQGVGSHFDPDIARTFLRIADRFHEIAMAFKDNEGELSER